MAQEKFDITKIGQRSWDIQELVNHMRKLPIVWSWGVKGWTAYKDLVLGFKVRGHHHKGYVYIALGWDDTFNVYIVSTHRNVKKEYKGIYIDQLIEIIDKDVERIDVYKR